MTRLQALTQARSCAIEASDFLHGQGCAVAAQALLESAVHELDWQIQREAGALEVVSAGNADDVP